MSFINPSPAGEDKDYSDDPVYIEGSTIIVSWSANTEAGLPVTLALFQQALGNNDGDPSQEVLVDASIADKTAYTWVVSTSKNLTVSNVFFFQLFLDQSIAPSATSHYFNITTNDAVASTTAATTTTASTSAATLFETSATTASTTATSSPAATTSSSPAIKSSGLSASAKVGIGVGIAVPVSLILGGILGWWCYKQRTRPTEPPCELPGYHAAETKSGNGLNNAGSLSPFGGSQNTYESRQFPHAYQLDGERTQFQAHELQ